MFSSFTYKAQSTFNPAAAPLQCLAVTVKESVKSNSCQTHIKSEVYGKIYSRTPVLGCEEDTASHEILSLTSKMTPKVWADSGIGLIKIVLL